MEILFSIVSCIMKGWHRSLFFFPFIYISWRLIILQYCSGFCHTLIWISHGFTCVPHPEPPSHLPPHSIPLGLPSAPAPALVSCIKPGLVICFIIAFNLSQHQGLFKRVSSSHHVATVYLRLLMFLLAILIPTCNSSSQTFCMIYSTYKLNKQGDNTQPWHTPFPVWNQSVVPCSVLTFASWPLYTFLRRQVRWSGIPISFRIFHSLLWPTQSKVLAESIKHLPSISNIFILFNYH